MEKLTMDELTNYCKNYGFIFQGSEIYGGLSNTWDFGPLGTLLKNNIKDAWKKRFIQEDSNNVGLDSAILMNPKVWEASGHLKTFSDPLIDCKSCKTRHRADQLLESANVKDVEKMSNDEMISYIKEIKLFVLNVVNVILLILGNSILCLKHFKVLLKGKKILSI
jgi:glycyl-tRNA synthetase